MTLGGGMGGCGYQFLKLPAAAAAAAAVHEAAVYFLLGFMFL